MPSSSFSFTDEVRPICEIADSDYEGDPDTWVWADVSCYVHEAETFAGRERFNERFEPGTASITFDNRTGWGDVAGSPAVVVTQLLRPGRQLRIGLVGPWGTRWLFRGWIDRTKPAYDPVLHDVVTVDCIDALGEAGLPIAPVGPLVGANETVTARINRVLDAVGWWPEQRIIGADATTVIATTLGGRAIDHMSQTADSAGGVVYGDLNGNVVYRDINWPLYDPDTPPDGTIGNVDPGTPPTPFEPGYIDPVPGYVYFPDPPPITSQTVIAVCTDGTEGTLVEQDDQYRILARDGTLLFESSGHFYDLGPFDGGCVAVALDPVTGDVDRWDDPDGDGVYEISDIPIVELPPAPPNIELLAYAQGGVADGLQSTVTVGPVTPGTDCMLFVMACAVNGTVGSSGLMTPGVTGGGLPWLDDAQYYDADNDYPGCGSFLTFVRVSRDDPGTFSVTLDWNGTSQSKCHAVALYRARGCSSDMYDRLRDRYRAYVTLSSNVPGIGSGKGPASFILFDATSPVVVELLPTDATICLSLAESTTSPYGATFGGAGDWTIDPLVVDIPREVSWNSGWRTNTLSPIVEWSEVNIGPENIQSCQVLVNIDPPTPLLFGWKIIAWRVAAPASGTIASGTNTIGLKADDQSMVVVFVSVTADHDMADAITCTHSGMTFTAAHRQHKTGSSWGQGAVFTGVVPAGVGGLGFANVVVGWVGHTIQTRSVVIYEVTNPGAVAAVAGGVLGNDTAGSVDGSSTITLSAAPAATSVVLASLHVRCDLSTAEGAQTGGDDYNEELEDNPNLRAYIHSQSRSPGEATSTSTTVAWNDVHTGTANTYSGVQLALEIGAGPDFVMYSDVDAALIIGGQYNAWNGPIYSAERRTGLDPNSGDLIWSFLPEDVAP